MSAVRILVPELRRTMMLPVGAGFLLVANWMSQDPMNAPWPGLVMPVLAAHQQGLILLVPLALGLGILIGGRDRASGLSGLLATFPRRWAPVVPRAVLLAGGLAVAYVVAPADQLFLAARAGAYWAPGWWWPLLVGGLQVLAAALLGLAIGRRLPSRGLALPVVLMSTVLAVGLYLLLEWIAGERFSRVLLLLPGYVGDDAGPFARIVGRADVGQAVWFAALAVAGLGLCRVTVWDRRRTLSTVAVLVSVAVAAALVVLPSRAQAQQPDAGAVDLVCADGLPEVCVARPYARVLPELVGPARSALRALAQLPDPPTSVRQDTRDPRRSDRQPADTVLVDLTLDHDGHLVEVRDWPVVADLLGGAGALWCGRGDDTQTLDREYADRVVTAAWLLGRPPPTSGITSQDAVIGQAWAALHRVPVAEQRARVAALRRARLDCRDDEFAALTGAG